MHSNSKKLSGLLLAGIMLAWLPGLSLAADQTEQAASATMMGEPTQTRTLLGENLSLQVGYKVWLAKWQTWNNLVTFNACSPQPCTNLTRGTEQLTSKFEPLQGPQFTLTAYNRAFLSLQYLNSAFKFSSAGTDPSNVAVERNGVIRSDLTLTTGVRVWKGFGVFAGYYQMLQHWGPASSFRIKGPILGLFGTAPIEDSPLSLYGNLAMGWMSFHPGEAQSLSTLRTDDVKAYSGEVGLNYAGPTIWKIGTSAQIGWRYQVLSQTFGRNATAGLAGSGLKANDVTWGPTFMISATF